jgi:superfamily II DNA or RNA helicase
VRGFEYNDEIEFLIAHGSRNRFICNLALSLKGNNLILFTRIVHGKELFKMIQEKAGKRKVFFVAGETATEDREEIRRILETEDDAEIVASYGTFSTGVNIPRLNNLVMASPAKSKIRVLQSIGRSLRLASDKDRAVLYDIADDLRHGPYTNHTLNHYEARIQLYAQERHPFKTYNIGISND